MPGVARVEFCDWSGVPRILLHANHTDKADALARQGSNKALRLPAIANRGANRIYPGAQCRFRYVASVPDSREQIISANDSLAVLDQIDKEIKDLRLQMDFSGAAAKFTPVRVESQVIETIDQGSLHRRVVFASF